MKSLYARMIEAGVETANHYSDLYVPVNDTTQRIIKEYNESVEPGHEVKPSTFVSNIDKKLWYDIVAMFDPYWESKRKETDKPVQLHCCCCDRSTLGRQWWNRDTGFGLCDNCIGMNGVSDVAVGEESSLFGIRGYHWDITNTGGKQ